MAENEAIKELKEAINCCTSGEDEHLKEALEMGILAIEELERRNKYLVPVKKTERAELEAFHAIGTVEEFKALKEKAEPKKPNYEGDGYYNGELVLDTWICPNCGKSYEVDYDNYDYCPNCGQNIDHSGLTEDD